MKIQTPGTLGGFAVLAAVLAAAPSAAPAPEWETTVASYNVRAAHLTAGPRSELEDGPARMRKSLAWLKAGPISIVALQELEKSARSVIADDPDWAVFHGNANTDSVRWDGGNAVMWKRDQWESAEGDAQQFPIRYNDIDGAAKTLWMPCVRLKNKDGGRSLTVVSIHNPSGPRREAIRADARRQEKDAIQTLLRDHDRVIVAGDFNEVQPAACFFTGFLKDATGYARRDDGTCPDSAPGHIDRIFGRGNLKFSNWQIVTKPRDAKWSDHPLVQSLVTYW